MAKTHSIGKLYWHGLIYPVKPGVLLDPAETQEIEEPFRGGKGWAVRLPFTRLALVVGKWHQAYDERIALTRAIAGRAIPESEFDWDTVRGMEDDI